MKPSRSLKSRSSGSCGSRKLGRRWSTCAANTGSAALTFYKWTAKYGGPEVSDAKRLKPLEDENAKLKKVAGGRDDGRLRILAIVDDFTRECPVLIVHTSFTGLASGARAR
jgi:hypothetical protein